MKDLNSDLYEVLCDWYDELEEEYDVIGVNKRLDTLHNTKGAIVASLIHEFPKSYVEAYESYSEVFQKIDVFEVYDKLDIINILSLATGSGGDVFGLVQGLETYFTGKQINIFTVEGNEDALRSQINIFKYHIEKRLIHNQVKLIPIPLVMDANFMNLRRELKERCFDKYNFKKFDIIQSFKWITESSVRRQFQFYQLYHLINKYLASNRIAILLEEINPYDGTGGGYPFFKRAWDTFGMFCKHNRTHNQLVLFKPISCDMKLSSKRCLECTCWYDEFEIYTKSLTEKVSTKEKAYAFVMKFATGALGKKLMNSLLQQEVHQQELKDEKVEDRIEYR